MHVGILFSVRGGRKSGFVTSEGCCTSTKLLALARTQLSIAGSLGWNLEESEALHMLSTRSPLARHSQTTSEDKRTAQLVKLPNKFENASRPLLHSEITQRHYTGVDQTCSDD